MPIVPMSGPSDVKLIFSLSHDIVFFAKANKFLTSGHVDLINLLSTRQTLGQVDYSCKSAEAIFHFNHAVMFAIVATLRQNQCLQGVGEQSSAIACWSWAISLLVG